jgi:hypothetical protein
MGSSEPMIPIEENTELRWTQMIIYFPLATAKKLIPDQRGDLNEQKRGGKRVGCG